MADYSDPMADCIPALSRPSPGLYGNASAIDPTTGLIGNDLSPYPNAAAGRGSPDDLNYNSPRVQKPPQYEKEPQTEFERYVASTVGQVLPIYGASLFERVPATFAPVDRVPVGADYVIAPGDEVQVVVWGQVNFSRRLIVSRTGELTLPDTGPVIVAGLNYSQAAAALKAAVARLYKNFDLSVTLGRLHSIQIFVVGDARRPGSYTVSSLSTLVNAIFASGGPSSRGSMRHIDLKRGGETVREFDLYDLLVRGDKSGDARLAPGDVIFIRAAGPRVAVAGSIERPGIYELRKGTTLGDVLRLADGLSAIAATQQVVLERVAAGAALSVLRIPLTDDGLSTQLANGDIIRVLPVVPRFENAVTLRGNVADPTRFPWHAGMHLSELIPNKESLVSRDYWKERNRVYTPPETPPVQIASSGETLDGVSQNRQTHVAAERSSGESTGNVTGVPVAFRDQPRNTQADTSFGAATGLDGVPPLRTFLPLNTIQPSAPDINWEYASIERIDGVTLATQIIAFHLGRLVIDHDPTEDLPLEPGDVVTIFSKADFSIPRAQQAKQVRLEGEIAMAGVYTVLPGETLRRLVARAGGLTQNAYLYGAQFTRESTRREQQKRYDDFLNQFERQVNEAASNLSSRVISPQQAATAQTSVASQRDLVERLRKVAMNGRIVLDMRPNSRGENDLPDLPLENGDRFYVPSRPSTVNVIGTVYEQTSFLYQEDLRVGDYLKKAGGPARSADKSHMFIIRADGSVVSKSVTVLFANSFDGLAMHPGDTLVVPTYINKSTFTRDLMDWSQIFSNLALGAAAVNVLH
ncbi:MAG: SLBB domain-containing protein [Acidobacteriaceae bacterium]|nr:SLBB domain-containing protein [Acidobacteriaceae bacterium]